MRKPVLAPLALVALLLGLLAHPVPAGASATAADSAWNDGRSDSDTIWNCALEGPSTGVSANTGWWSPSGRVPMVGEKFYIRGYIGLVGLPCSGTVKVLPELLAPVGTEYVDEDVRWDIHQTGQVPDLGTDGLELFNGVNGGYVIAAAGDEPFILRQGETLEFQFPVRATREMKGPATQRPECRDRIDGVAPCPISQAGDHFQIAFAVRGHTGDKSYVTPYVGLFAARPGGGGGPSTPQATSPSTTRATYSLKAGKRGKAVVTVSSAKVPTGRLVVTDKGKVIARGALSAAQRGRTTITLPTMRKGAHKLVVRYLGSSAVKPSASAPKRVTLR